MLGRVVQRVYSQAITDRWRRLITDVFKLKDDCATSAGNLLRVALDSCTIPGMAEASHPTLGEEIANSLSHGAGLGLAIAGAPILITAAVRYGTAWNTVGVSVFAGSMIALYLASTLYHALRHDRAKRFFRVLDHSAIFILIAGTYTPFTLGVLRGPWGWTLFGLVWGLAAIGLVKKAIFGARFVWLSVTSRLWPSVSSTE